MILLTVLGYLLLFLLIVLLLILIIPVDYHLLVLKDSSMIFQVAVGWFWRLIQVDFTITDNRLNMIKIKLLGFPMIINPSREEKTTYKQEHKLKIDKKKKIKNKKIKPKGKFPLTWEHLTRELINTILLALRRILNLMKPKHFSLKGVYGFDDPYYTGMMVATTSSLDPLFENAPIELTPSFEEQKLEGEAQVQGTIIVILFLWVLLRFTLSKPIRRMIKIIFINKKEEKKHVN